MNVSSLLLSLLTLWGALAAVLILLVIYRSIVSMKREGQLFLDPGEAHLEAEQQEILRKLDRVTPIIKWLSLLVGLLTLAIAGLWIYQGLNAGPFA